MTKEPITGGCQCGAVRYSAASLGRATICHCRMCQKAFGNFFGPLVHVKEFAWTRGKPKTYESSNKAQRGFCDNCGTPLSYGFGKLEIAIGTLDNPELAAPVLQVNPTDMLSYFGSLHELPVRSSDGEPSIAAFVASVVNNQHPDHDTEEWPEK